MSKQLFVFTRFSVANINEEWLNVRLELFYRYCLPSILNQTCKDFTWIFFFDSNTPFFYVDRILNCGFENVIPVVVNEKKSFFVGLNKEITRVAIEVVKKNVYRHDTIVTARLDSDDCLHRNFVEYLKGDEVSEVGNYYGFPLGYRYEVESKIFYTYRVSIHIELMVIRLFLTMKMQKI